MFRIFHYYLPLLWLFFTIVYLASHVDAMSCYQDQVKYGMVSGSSPTPTPCLMAATGTCIKIVDYSQQLVTRACQSTNCTGSDKIIGTSVCQNTTSYPFSTICCCYGDGCNGEKPPISLLPSNATVYAAVICAPRGVWGNWSDWSECPGQSADPIFEQLTELNTQTRYRECLPQPVGCKRQGPFMCDGPHWEQRPCGRRPPGNGTSPAAIFLPAGFSNINLMMNGTG